MIQAFLAALALPVVGFVTGRVVGDYYSLGGRIGEIGMGVGIAVYTVALMASYAHLRNFYARFEHHPARAAPFIALAVEVVTFYLSFSYVVLHSPWAFWGSLVGAFVVFWGNFQSMASSWSLRKEDLARSPREGLEAKRGVGAAPSGRREETPPPPGHVGVYPPGKHPHFEAEASSLEGALLGRSAPSRPQNGVPSGTPFEEGRGEVFPPSDTLGIRAEAPFGGKDARAYEAPSRALPKGKGTPLPVGGTSPLSGGDTAGEEGDPTTRIILEMAERGEVGPSVVAKALGISKSTAHYKLKTLTEEGLMVRNERGYTRKV